MESLTSYLTAEGWRNDWNQTKEDFKYFFSKWRRPIISGIEEPSELEVTLYKEKEREKGIIGKITEVYFRPKSFEKSCRLYDILGVRLFKKLVMGTFGNLLKLMGGHRKGGSFSYFVSQTDRNLKELKRFESGTRFNELVHTPLMYSLGYSALEDFSKGNFEGGLFCVSVAVINAYCVMLQRYNRARVYNTIEEKLKEK